MLTVFFSLGIQIIFTLDEVAFIQNLVFYIEKAYCIPVSQCYPSIKYMLWLEFIFGLIFVKPVACIMFSGLWYLGKRGQT